jgi:hypothetical protein
MTATIPLPRVDEKPDVTAVHPDDIERVRLGRTHANSIPKGASSK